jgi:hypothetical protein
MSLTLPHPIEHYREWALTWCRWAVGQGRTVDDPVYSWVTEWRDPGPIYSSCADLAHWMLYRLGVRCDWINRDEHKGFARLVAVARLVRPPVGSNRLASSLDGVWPGDILVTWDRQDTTDAHVSVVCAAEAKEWTTFDFGQAPLQPVATRVHETATKVRAFSVGELGVAPELDGRSIRSVLRLDRVLPAAQEQGLLVEPDLPSGERLDELDRTLRSSR